MRVWCVSIPTFLSFRQRLDRIFFQEAAIAYARFAKAEFAAEIAAAEAVAAATKLRIEARDAEVKAAAEAAAEAAEAEAAAAKAAARAADAEAASAAAGARAQRLAERSNPDRSDALKLEKSTGAKEVVGGRSSLSGRSSNGLDALPVSAKESGPFGGGGKKKDDKSLDDSVVGRHPSLPPTLLSPAL